MCEDHAEGAWPSVAPERQRLVARGLMVYSPMANAIVPVEAYASHSQKVLCTHGSFELMHFSPFSVVALQRLVREGVLLDVALT